MDPWTHYPHTLLRFPDDGRTIDLRQALSAENLAFLRGLFPRGRFAIVTPANPRGENADRATNDDRLRALAAELDILHIPARRVDGTSPDGSHVEPGLAIPLKLLAAVRLAHHWEQLGLFWFDGERVWLVPADHSHHAQPLPETDGPGVR